MDGVRLEPSAPAPVNADESAVLTVPPTDLQPKAAQAFWRLAAPEAIAQRTLVSGTVLGFRELCQQWAMKEEIAKDIAHVGPAHPGSGENLKHFARLAQRVDASLARFKLTAFGKPVDGAARKPAASPWAQVGR